MWMSIMDLGVCSNVVKSNTLLCNTWIRHINSSLPLSPIETPPQATLHRDRQISKEWDKP